MSPDALSIIELALNLYYQPHELSIESDGELLHQYIVFEISTLDTVSHIKRIVKATRLVYSQVGWS
ncbi:hypothetical protein [Kaarinaea lacus]